MLESVVDLQYSCKVHIFTLSKRSAPLFLVLEFRAYEVSFDMMDRSPGSPGILKDGNIIPPAVAWVEAASRLDSA